MVDFINYAESYAFALILSDRHDLLDCATSPGDYFNEGCQVIDIDNVLPHDQMQDYLYGMNSPLYEAFIYPYEKDYPISSQTWYEYLEHRPSTPIAVFFLSDNLNTNVDFVSRVVPSLSFDNQDLDFYFSQYAFQSSFLDAIPNYTSHFFRGFAPKFDPMGSLFSMPTSGFYERFYDSSNGMDAFHNPQSVFVYDSMMLAFMAILHNAKIDNKGDGADISNMLRTFKSFDNASSGGSEFTLTPQGIQNSLNSSSDSFQVVGLSGQQRYTTEQDASLSSVIWQMSYGQLSYLYSCENSLSSLQDMAINCDYE